VSHGRLGVWSRLLPFLLVFGTIVPTAPSSWAQSLPTLSITDASVSEGNSGTTEAKFTVSLLGASDRKVTVQFATGGGCFPGCCSTIDAATDVPCPLDPQPLGRGSQGEASQNASRAPCLIEPDGISFCYGGGTATPGIDYTATSGTLTFDPGDKSKSLSVEVKGDTQSESNETFFVSLSNATEAAIADGLGQGTIVDDDQAASVDLAITQTDAPDPATVGATLTYTVSVTNRGSGNATGVKLVDPLPRGVSIGSVTPSRGSCERQKRTITCSLGSLDGGSSATVTIVVTPTKAGTLTNQASVTGDQPEQDLANNKATQGTTVTSRR